MKKINFFSCFIILYLFLARGKTNENKIKPSIVEEIVHKVANMTLKSLSRAPVEEKTRIIKMIEEKVKNASSAMGADGHKYLKIIMHGVKLVAINHTKENNHILATTKKEIHFMRAHNTIDDQSPKQEQKMKDQAVINIAAKIENLANKYLKNAKTQEDKRAIVENIKFKVIETANRRHLLIHNKHDEVKSLSNLISKGVDLMMKRNLENGSRTMDTELIKNIEKIKITNEIINNNIPVYRAKDNTALDCNYEIGKTCADIRSLNKLICSYDKKVFPLEKLCDGVSDCLDRSDEQDCPQRAVEKIRKAGRIIAKVDSSLVNKCVKTKPNSPLDTKQNDVLRSVLESQLKFIEKYTDITSQMLHPKININRDTLQKTANEVALVVSSLSIALDGTLCARRVGFDNIEDITNKYMNDYDPDKAFDDLLKKPALELQTCDCKGLLCSNNSCTESCKSVCWQKYSLDRWSCRAVDDGPSVPLDAICDGKLDCYDETDESGCVTASGYTKFEANSKYDHILKLISTKANLKEYQSILTDLLTIYESIKLLQKVSIKQNIEMINIKVIRDKIFSKIINIYDHFLRKGNEKALNEIYDFLISLNEKLVGAMKHSSTGNDRIVTSAGCYCTGKRCGVPNCSKLCLRACSVESLLTRYRCGNINLNYSVPIESVCDGKSNCPNGEDEYGCKTDVCRHHHLILLRHNLQDVGNKYRGTALGEALMSWKTKVTSMLLIAEKNDRPTSKQFIYLISNILHDLVMSYASFEEFKRNINERNLREFEIMSQHVIDGLKTCGK